MTSGTFDCRRPLRSFHVRGVPLMHQRRYLLGSGRNSDIDG